jgi:hypothetical protein
MRKHVTKKHPGFMEVKKHGQEETNGGTPATNEEGAAETADPATQGKAP